MTVTEIPLNPDAQTFSISLAGSDYQMRVLWRATCWYLDLMDASGAAVITGIPLVTGADLLDQYQHLGLGFALHVRCDAEGQEYPTETDLGSGSHLFVVTE